MQSADRWSAVPTMRARRFPQAKGRAFEKTGGSRSSVTDCAFAQSLICVLQSEKNALLCRASHGGRSGERPSRRDYEACENDEKSLKTRIESLH